MLMHTQITDQTWAIANSGAEQQAITVTFAGNLGPYRYSVHACVLCCFRIVTVLLFAKYYFAQNNNP